MKTFVEILNATDAELRRFDAADDYTPPVHKFGAGKATRIVPLVIEDAPTVDSAHAARMLPAVVEADAVRVGWEIVSAPTPQSVPLWAFRAVLTVQGITPQVDGLIAALPEPQKTVAQVQWEFGNFIDRDHPLIVAMGAEIGLTPDQIDDVFRQAAQLK